MASTSTGEGRSAGPGGGPRRLDARGAAGPLAAILAVLAIGAGPGVASAQARPAGSARGVAVGTPPTAPLTLTGWRPSRGPGRTHPAVAVRGRRAANARADRVTGHTALQTLISTAAGLILLARADNLDPGAVPRLAGELRGELRRGQPVAATVPALAAAIAGLRQLIALNGEVAAQAQSTLAPIDQAAAEQVRGSRALLAADRAAEAALTTARTAAGLRAVQQRLLMIGRQAAARLAAGRCGHALPAGRVITISLSLEEMVFYANGCAVRATPVTTGRALLRTPTGTFRIFDKQSPYVFVSPWPPGSPFWYPTSPVNWVMEFDQGGYYIHDAPWEPPSAFGPNSENGVWASHGCVHTPEATMRWAYGWTPLGAPVIVSA